jgi:hypothetical protein
MFESIRRTFIIITSSSKDLIRSCEGKNHPYKDAGDAKGSYGVDNVQLVMIVLLDGTVLTLMGKIT